MYHRILVALDGLACSEQVFNCAVSLAQITHARLLLLHVLVAEDGFSVCRFESDTHHSSEQNSLGQTSLEHHSLNALRSHINSVMATGAIADLRLSSGNPGQQICEIAQNWGADLILMGHRNLTDSSNPDYCPTSDSISFYVLDHAPCPVLIMPDAIALSSDLNHQFAAMS
jgi:nucleotide-binding universal stress UspA family protein